MTTTNFQIPNPADIPDNSFLQWDAVAGRFNAVPAPSGGSITPLATELFVDPGSTAVGTPDGSIGLPFLNLQDAVDAASAVAGVLTQIRICWASGIGAGPAAWTDKKIALIGEGPGNTDSPMVVVGNLAPSGPDSTLSLENIRIEDQSGGVDPAIDQDGGGALYIRNSAIDFEIVLAGGAGLVAEFTHFGGDITGALRAINCTFGTINISGLAEFDRLSAIAAQSQAVTFDLTPANLEPSPYYGDGSDGSIDIAGTVTLTRDTYYVDVSFSDPAATIVANGFRLFISGLLDLRNAPAGAIDYRGPTGAAAAGQTAGASTVSGNSGTLLTGGSSGAGGKGGAIGAAGAAAAAISSSTIACHGGIGGVGAAGGDSVGKGGAGGTITTGGAQPWPRFPNLHFGNFGINAVAIRSAFPGSGGGGGGGGLDVGGGGGAGGACPTDCQIFARCIRRDATTNAAAIRGDGGIGGLGGTAGAGGGAGGAGGGGAGGTGIFIVYDWALGVPTDCITANGGTGGAGGDGTGGDPGGTGGTGGASGIITLGNMITNDWLVEPSVAGSAGSGPAASVGGAGGAGGIATADFV
jgi:hypothetical protein